MGLPLLTGENLFEVKREEHVTNPSI